ncbi:MAG: hypothetical protein HYX47_20070 [Burkholderiales bacterium]|nr:hypothetical protein [Burkholderiales bacterium]
MAIAVQDTLPALIAHDPAGASCLRCQDMMRHEAAAQAVQPRPLSARALVQRLVDHLNNNDTTRLEELLAGSLLKSLSAQRMSRLHQLFPGWCATVDELIADEGSAVLRYQVSFADAFSLLGCLGPAVKTGQAIVLRLANHRITDACPIVDDFAFWSGRASTADTGCAHCIPHTNVTEGSINDRHYY